MPNDKIRQLSIEFLERAQAIEDLDGRIRGAIAAVLREESSLRRFALECLELVEDWGLWPMLISPKRIDRDHPVAVMLWESRESVLSRVEQIGRL